MDPIHVLLSLEATDAFINAEVSIIPNDEEAKLKVKENRKGQCVFKNSPHLMRIPDEERVV